MESDLDATADERARILRAFVSEGRLVQIPARRKKRRVVLDVIAQSFSPGAHYDEAAVNVLLARWHPDDVATLRRLLVDEGFLDRSGGVYWRSGGTVDVD